MAWQLKTLEPNGHAPTVIQFRSSKCLRHVAMRNGFHCIPTPRKYQLRILLGKRLLGTQARFARNREKGKRYGIKRFSCREGVGRTNHFSVATQSSSSLSNSDSDKHTPYSWRSRLSSDILRSAVCRGLLRATTLDGNTAHCAGHQQLRPNKWYQWLIVPLSTDKRFNPRIAPYNQIS